MSRAGAVIDGCQLVKPIGEGPFGVVWLAKDARTQRNVAVKLLKPHIVTQSYGRSTFARLQAALRAYADLQHKNIAAMLRAVQEPRENAYGVASDFVEGQSLDRLQLQLAGQTSGRTIDPKRLGRLLGWFEQISAVLAWLHAKSVIHGNLKPTNLILVQGSNNQEVKVLDLAWSAIGVAVPPPGAPSYLAPEQLSGSPPTAASDQCSLMTILHRYLTQGGRRLVQEEGVPAMLVQLVERAMKPIPNARFGSMHEVTEQLRSVRRALQEESTDKAVVVNPTRPIKQEVRLGAAAPQGFADEPETVRLPVVEPPAPMPKVVKRSTSKPQLPGSGPTALLDDFEGGDFIASVDPEPQFELGDMRLPDDSSILSRPDIPRSSSRGTSLMIAGAIFFLAAGGVVFFTQTKMGRDVTSVEAATGDPTKALASPSDAKPALDGGASNEAPAKNVDAKRASDGNAAAESNAPRKTHGDSPTPADVKAPVRAEDPKAADDAKPGAHADSAKKTDDSKAAAHADDGRTKKRPKNAKLEERADEAMERLAQLSEKSSDASKAATAPTTDKTPQGLDAACDEGDGSSCARLGDLLRAGRGVGKSETKARSTFERGCKFHEKDACHKAAEMWSEGQGGEKDATHARDLEDKACELGRKASCKAN